MTRAGGDIARNRATLAFVRALVSRYRVRSQRAPLRLVLLRPHATGGWHQVIVQRPYIALSMRLTDRAEARTSASVISTTVSRASRAGPTVSPSTRPTPTLERSRAVPLTRAIAVAPAVVRAPSAPAKPSRSARAAPPAAIPAPPRERARDVIAPPAQVLRQASVVTPPPAPVTTSPAFAPVSMASRRAPSLGTEPSRPPRPMIDIRQLTDQVIRAIDQRIAAQRERLGRP